MLIVTKLLKQLYKVVRVLTSTIYSANTIALSESEKKQIYSYQHYIVEINRIVNSYVNNYVDYYSL